MKKKKINIQLEKNITSGDLWGLVKVEDCLIVTVGSDIEQVTGSIRELIDDCHKEGELQVGSTDVEFTYSVCLIDFFEKFSALNITEVAKLSGMNVSLLRQYASHSKKASLKQARKIQKTVNELGEKLAKVTLV